MSTCKLIETVTVGAGGTSTITFSSIPQTYTDLLLVGSTRTSNASDLGYVAVRFNGDSGNNYTYKFLNGFSTGIYNGSSSSTSFTFASTSANSTTANTFGSFQFYIPRYTASTYKAIESACVTENNGTGAYMDITTSIWNSTSAITSIVVSDYINSSTIMQYSKVSLYGIKNS